MEMRKRMAKLTGDRLLKAAINHILLHPETWDQSTWHSSCKTKHCIAGTCQILAGFAPDSLGAPNDAKTAIGLSDADANYLFSHERTLSEIYFFAKNMVHVRKDAHIEYDEKGFDRDGFDQDGFDKDGFDKEGYGRDGFDKDGYGRDGFDRAGFDRDGYGKDGFDRDEYDREGYNLEGRDRDGFDRDGYGVDGYDRSGFDRVGYDRFGFDRFGFDRLGFDRSGRGRDGKRLPLFML